MLEIQICITGINYILKIGYIKIVNSHFELIIFHNITNSFYTIFN